MKYKLKKDTIVGKGEEPVRISGSLVYCGDISLNKRGETAADTIERLLKEDWIVAVPEPLECWVNVTVDGVVLGMYLDYDQATRNAPDGCDTVHMVQDPDVCISGSLCHHSGWFNCIAASPSGFQCTRMPGHSGVHIACGTKHNLRVWG